MPTLTPRPSARVRHTATAIVWLSQDRILRVVNRPGSVHEKQDALENIAAIPEEEWALGCGLLIDFRQLRSMSRDAREVYRTRGSANAVAIAIVVESPLSKAIGNFFVGLSKPPCPTKLFTSTELAEAWLGEQIAARGD